MAKNEKQEEDGKRKGLIFVSELMDTYDRLVHDLFIGCTPGLLRDRAKIMKNFTNIIFFKFNFR